MSNEKAESSTDNTSVSALSSNYEILEAARLKASALVVKLDQFYLEIHNEIKVYSDVYSLLGDNSDNLENDDNNKNNIQTTDDVVIIGKENQEANNQASIFSTELTSGIDNENRNDSNAISLMPKLWAGRNLHTLPSLIQILDTRASDRYAQGMIALKSGKWIDAISHFTHCVHLKPNEPSYYVNRAEIFIQLADFQSAILNYKRACILDPYNEEFFHRLGFLYIFQSQILFDQGLYSSSLEAIGRAIEMEPSNPTFQVRAIACLAAMHRHSECLALVNKQIDRNNTNADFYVLRAKLHSHFRNFSLSYYDLMAALAINSDHHEARYVLDNMACRADIYKREAVELALSNRLQDAASRISLAIDLNPVVGEYHVTRGAFYRRLGNFTAAIDDLIMAMDKVDHNENNDDYRQAHRQLTLTFNDFAVQCFKSNYFDDAVKWLHKAIHRDQSEPQFYFNRGDCFFKLQQWDFSLADYEQASSLSSDFYRPCQSRIALVHFSIGHQKFIQSDYLAAEESLTKAICIDPSLSIFWNLRASTRHALHNFSGAKKDVINSMFLSGIHTNLGSICSRLFPNQSFSDIIKSKLAICAKKELDKILRERENYYKNFRQTISTETREPDRKNTVISSCYPEDKMLFDSIYQYSHLEDQIKKCTSDKSFMKKNNANILPLPDLTVPAIHETDICRVGSLKDGSKFYVDNKGAIIKAEKPRGWRKFKEGIETR